LTYDGYYGIIIAMNLVIDNIKQNKQQDFIEYDISLPDYAWKWLDMLLRTEILPDDDCTPRFKSMNWLIINVLTDSMFRLGKANVRGCYGEGGWLWDNDCPSRMDFEIENCMAELEREDLEMESRNVRFTSDFFDLYDKMFDIEAAFYRIVEQPILGKLRNKKFAESIISGIVFWGLKKGIICQQDH
jgi:hypothetical protein